MSSDEIRERTQKVWDRFYEWGRGVETLGMYADAAGARGLCTAVEAIPADVCGDGHLDR